MSSLVGPATETLNGLTELVADYQPGSVFVLVDRTDMYLLFQTGNKAGKNIRPTDVVVWPSKDKSFSELSISKLKKAKTVLVLLALIPHSSRREILTTISEHAQSAETIKSSFPGKVDPYDLRGSNWESFDKIFLFHMENELSKGSVMPEYVRERKKMISLKDIFRLNWSFSLQEILKGKR